MRAIEALRDYLGAPLVYDRDRNGYHYERSEEPLYELPGLWFNDAELYALMVSHRLLTEIQPGLLEAQIKPLRERIERLLQHRRAGSAVIEQRIRILQSMARPTRIEHFRTIATAVLQRRRLRILYHGRARDETSERDVSPQRLVYYRDNWYLDAWCHLRDELRSFSVDRVHPVYIADDPADDVPDETMDELVTRSYGIFAGQPTNTAVLRFTPEASKWVGDEHWHPQQEMKVRKNGGVELRVPYSDPRELIMEIMKHGADVEVIGPAVLRREVARRHADAAGQYHDSALGVRKQRVRKARR